MKSLQIVKLSLVIILLSLVSSYDVWKDGQYLVTWNLNPSDSTITFDLDVGVTGWVGLGFSQDGYMANSDMIMSYIDNAGQAQVSDRWASGRSTPDLDTSLNGTSDLTLLSGSLVNGRTKLSFKRKLDTGDKNDFAIKQGASVNVIFAIRDKGNPATDNGQFNPHTRFASTKLILWDSNSSSTQITTGAVNTIDLLMNNFEVPKDQTTYKCMYFQVDKMLQNQMKSTNLPNYHAIKFEAISKTKFVHHMIIYQCIQTTKYVAGFWDCMDMPVYCSIPMALAGANTAPITTPDQAGFIWGSGVTKIVALQVHYNNDNAEVGKIDNSGMRIHFTDKLRTYNMGTATLGYFMPLISLPPKQSSLVLTDTCSAKCTSKIPSSGIYFSIVMLHGHQLMTKTKLKINFSNGSSDNYNIGTDNYDFGAQYIRNFDPPLKVSANDTITTTCEYSTMSRTITTYGGHSSYDEMCFGFVSYYPAEVGFDFCISGMCPSYMDTSSIKLPPSSAYQTYLKTDLLIILVLVIIYLLF
jgi:hypothetical protein